MAAEGRSGGIRRTVTGPAGERYLLQAAPSGWVEWPGRYQPASGAAAHLLVMAVLHRVVFRGGWTVVLWRGDRIAPKRTTVLKRRYPDEYSAVAVLEELARTLPEAEPPAT